MSGNSASGSQCDRVLAVLKDGRPHTMEEIHRHAGFMRLNSRISDLRHRGHNIRCDRRNGHYTYQLVDTLDAPSAAIGEGLAEGASSVPAAASDTTAQTPSPEPPGTLVLFECVVDESAGLRGAYSNEAA